MYIPVNPSFTIKKWGVMWYTLHGHISMMDTYNKATPEVKGNILYDKELAQSQPKSRPRNLNGNNQIYK